MLSMLDSISRESFYIWLFVALILCVFEILTPGLFFFIAFACGACVAAGVAVLEFGFHMQALAAFIGFVISFFVIRLIFEHKQPSKITNIFALIGCHACVTKKIAPHERGAVIVGREQWPALTLGSHVFHKDTIVKVVGVEGNALIVTSKSLHQ